MASTNFIPGTVITSEWLNEVDEGIFETLPSISSTAPGKGAALVGFTRAVIPAAIDKVDWGLRTAETGTNALAYIPPAEWAAIFNKTSVFDATAYLQAALDSFVAPSSGYEGGLDLYLPQGTYRTSSPLVYKSSGITINGAGGLSSVIKPLPGFVGTEILRIDPADHASYVIYRQCSVRNVGFDHVNAPSVRSITGLSLNDGCEFAYLRSYNFSGTVFVLGKSARPGAILSQGVDVRAWHAITSIDLLSDVFIVEEANEVMFQSCKALGLSIGVSSAVGFHIGKGALAQGITMIGNSVAHIPGGVGIRFNRAERCWAANNTLENCLHDIVFSHDTTASLCLFNEAYSNRHYPTPGMPATQRDIYIDRAQSCRATLRENGSAEITSAALNCEVSIATNRTSGSSGVPATVTLASTSSVVHETHKNGVATHHSNSSVTFDATSPGVFDVVFPGGGFVRGDSTRISLVAAAGKGARLVANGASIEVDASGRALVSGLTTAVPPVSNALYKDASGFVKIT